MGTPLRDAMVEELQNRLSGLGLVDGLFDDAA